VNEIDKYGLGQDILRVRGVTRVIEVSLNQVLAHVFTFTVDGADYAVSIDAGEPWSSMMSPPPISREGTSSPDAPWVREPVFAELWRLLRTNGSTFKGGASFIRASAPGGSAERSGLGPA
jgi:hypothetical protein